MDAIAHGIMLGMFSKMLRQVHTELVHYRSLHKDVQRLLISYALYLAAYPLVMTFMDAYFWRVTGSILAIIVYNFGYIIGLPLGFYLNGLLLKKFHVLRLYFVGALLQGLIACSVVFFTTRTFFDVGVFGLIFGVGAGLFWGNKNYLDLKLTKNTNRVYYNSLGQVADLCINILVPAVAGWFIAFGHQTGWYLPQMSYRVLMLVGFGMLALSGYVVQSSTIASITIDGLVVRHPTQSWQLARIFHLLYNLQVGLNLVTSSVLILFFVGGEGIFGTVHAMTAALSAVAIYLIGRKTTVRHSWMFVGIGSILFFVGASVLAGVFTWVGSLVYAAITTTLWAVQWSTSYTVFMELMDQEASSPSKQYAYVCDNELFFNIGRGVGIGVVVLFLMLFSQQAALRWTPLVIATIQLILVLPIKILTDTVVARKKGSYESNSHTY